MAYLLINLLRLILTFLGPICVPNKKTIPKYFRQLFCDETICPSLTDQSPSKIEVHIQEEELKLRSIPKKLLEKGVAYLAKKLTQ